MIQMSIPYQRHSETSKAAAESQRSTLSEKQKEVYNFLKRNPATDKAIGEMGMHLGWAEPTARVRRIELTRKGLVVKKQCRGNLIGCVNCDLTQVTKIHNHLVRLETGRSAQVWRVK